MAETSTGQEDFQAFTALAAEKLGRLLDNVELVLAYELTALAQATILRDEPLPPGLQRAGLLLREVVPRVADDRPLAPDVERVVALVRTRALL